MANLPQVFSLFYFWLDSILVKLISALTTKDFEKTSKLIVEQPTITHVVDSLLLFARENKLESLLVVSSYKLLIQNSTKKRLYKISFT